jgi:hypothetical protein
VRRLEGDAGDRGHREGIVAQRRQEGGLHQRRLAGARRRGNSTMRSAISRSSSSSLSRSRPKSCSPIR